MSSARLAPVYTTELDRRSPSIPRQRDRRRSAIDTKLKLRLTWLAQLSCQRAKGPDVLRVPILGKVGGRRRFSENLTRRPDCHYSEEHLSHRAITNITASLDICQDFLKNFSRRLKFSRSPLVSPPERADNRSGAVRASGLITPRRIPVGRFRLIILLDPADNRCGEASHAAVLRAACCGRASMRKATSPRITAGAKLLSCGARLLGEEPPAFRFATHFERQSD